MIRALIAVLLLSLPAQATDILKITFSMALTHWTQPYLEEMEEPFADNTPATMIMYIELDAVDQDANSNHGVFYSSSQTGMVQLYFGDSEMALFDQVTIETYHGLNGLYGFFFHIAQGGSSSSAIIPVGGMSFDTTPGYEGLHGFSAHSLSSSIAPTDALMEIYNQRNNPFHKTNVHAYMNATSLADDSDIIAEADDVISWTAELVEW